MPGICSFILTHYSTSHTLSACSASKWVAEKGDIKKVNGIEDKSIKKMNADLKDSKVFMGTKDTKKCK